MKKVLISLILLSLIVIAACTPKTETPNNDQTQIKTDCSDSNECTTDSFNELTKQCEHVTKENCCGNAVCEPSERECDFSTYQTKCVQDCNAICPAKVVVNNDASTNQHEFSFKCSDSNCKQITDSEFEITGLSSIQTTLVNLGEMSSSAITSNFDCKKDSSLLANADGDSFKGIIFKDYFNNNEENLDSLNSRIQSNNKATYYLQFDASKRDIPTKFVCNIALASQIGFKNIQVVTICIC